MIYKGWTVRQVGDEIQISAPMTGRIVERIPCDRKADETELRAAVGRYQHKIHVKQYREHGEVNEI